MKNGYYRGHFRLKDGTFVHKMVHQLVAQAFLDNPNNYPIVNHKNSNRSDNRATNLEWCSGSYNNNHAIENNKNHRGIRAVEMIDFVTRNPIEQFNTIQEASEKTDISYHIIYQCAANKQASTNSGKITFRYIEKPEKNKKSNVRKKLTFKK